MRRIAVVLFALLLFAIALPVLLKRPEPLQAISVSIDSPLVVEKKEKLPLPVERAPASLPKKAVATVVPADIQSEMDQLGADWDKAREDLYARFQLSEEQKAHIEEAREINAKTLDSLAKSLSTVKDPEERNRLVAKIVETGFFYDRAVTEIVGEKNFAALENLRDSYNEYLDNHSSLRPRLAHRW